MVVGENLVILFGLGVDGFGEVIYLPVRKTVLAVRLRSRRRPVEGEMQVWLRFLALL